MKVFLEKGRLPGMMYMKAMDLHLLESTKVNHSWKADRTLEQYDHPGRFRHLLEHKGTAYTLAILFLKIP